MNMYHLYQSSTQTWTANLYSLFQLRNSHLPAESKLRRAGCNTVTTLGAVLREHGERPLLAPPPAEVGTPPPAAVYALPQDVIHLIHISCSLFVSGVVMSACIACTALLFGLVFGLFGSPHAVGWSLTGGIIGLLLGLIFLLHLLEHRTAPRT